MKAIEIVDVVGAWSNFMKVAPVMNCRHDLEERISAVDLFTLNCDDESRAAN